MRLIGLTGGIASGKSLVSRQLQGLGAAVIDADRIARDVVQPGSPGWEMIVREFGRICYRQRWRVGPEGPGAVGFQQPHRNWRG